ncbi:helix-turn-helix domain-containing protein [Streptomyces sp. NBC_01477]|uniref:helix-turn-helix domain-containing protein n=1 Tax=Streptomyces sp. NBC_01477 TaxID=2976015 RepID=UPI002E379F65|nr:helix-turn-helix domain-containing protein [Streptomyces sp. NBC_01477]
MSTTPTLVDAYAASAATGIKPGTIRVLLHRGKLAAHGRDHAGRTLVALEDVTAYAQRRAAA